MKHVLYLECYSGISGDMLVGALLDLGASRHVLEEAIASLSMDGYELYFGRTEKCGIDAYRFDVILDHHHHDHYHGDHHHHHHEHAHRNLNEIKSMIAGLHVKDRVKKRAEDIFEIIAKAESKAHNIPVEKVHFHEVGAIDSIIDIVGAAVCLEDLHIDHVVVSPLFEGRGHVHCQHGSLPVPVPAVANIVSSHGLDMNITDTIGEMVTPTGAAIAAAVSNIKTLPKQYVIRKIGIGAGTRDFQHANILRAMLVDWEENGDSEEMWMLESNIDDCSGEVLGYTMECLLKAGAADVWYSPVYMKKNRPAYQLSVLCSKSEREKLETLIFKHTTTIGIRKWPVERTIMPREILSVLTRYGEVFVKVCSWNQKTYYYPEYESVRSVCEEKNLEYQVVYQEAVNQADIQYSGRGEQ